MNYLFVPTLWCTIARLSRIDTRFINDIISNIGTIIAYIKLTSNNSGEKKMRVSNLVMTVVVCVSTSVFAGVKERVISACQNEFSDNHMVFQCVQSTDDVNLIRHCGNNGGSESRVLRCIQNGGGGSYNDYGPIVSHPEDDYNHGSPIKQACKAELSFSSSVKECKQVASSVDAVEFCGDQYSFDSDVIECLEIVSNSYNETKKMKVINACNSELTFQSGKDECIEIAKNRRVVESCAARETFDSDILRCIQKKSR